MIKIVTKTRSTIGEPISLFVKQRGFDARIGAKPTDQVVILSQRGNLHWSSIECMKEDVPNLIAALQELMK